MTATIDLERLKNSLEVIWGAEAIGQAIGLTRRQAFYALEKGQLRGAVKIGERWCITARALLANVDPTAAGGSDTKLEQSTQGETP